MAEKKNLSLSTRILIAMVAGAVVGWILSALGNPAWSQLWLIDGLFRVLGQVFIALLHVETDWRVGCPNHGNNCILDRDSLAYDT